MRKFLTFLANPQLSPLEFLAIMVGGAFISWGGLWVIAAVFAIFLFVLLGEVLKVVLGKPE